VHGAVAVQVEIEHFMKRFQRETFSESLNLKFLKYHICEIYNSIADISSCRAYPIPEAPNKKAMLSQR